MSTTEFAGGYCKWLFGVIVGVDCNDYEAGQQTSCYFFGYLGIACALVFASKNS